MGDIADMYDCFDEDQLIRSFTRQFNHCRCGATKKISQKSCNFCQLLGTLPVTTKKITVEIPLIGCNGCRFQYIGDYGNNQKCMLFNKWHERDAKLEECAEQCR